MNARRHAGGVHRRRRAWRRGLWAERLAAWWLRGKGFRILARRFSCPQGEIDLVAKRFGLVIFVEVKARAGGRAAAEALGSRQRRRIEAAARTFLQRHPELAAGELRFDAVLVAPWRPPRHLKDAWRPDF